MSEPVLARPSATVMLVRDRPRFEVLMVRRHHEIEFASGALVFPGGKVEPGDGDPAWADFTPSFAEAPAEERALRICAIREAFEESGILIGHYAHDPGTSLAAKAAGERDRLRDGHCTFLELVAGLGVVLDLGAMRLFAHWITPTGMPKRFDTRFYLMTAPADQIAACDGCETVEAEWIEPTAALRRHARGDRTILFPTRLNLALLAESRSVEDAFAKAAARRVVAVEPTLERRQDGTYAAIPADAGYGEVAPQRL